MNKYSKTILILFLLLPIISFASAAVSIIEDSENLEVNSLSVISIGSYVQVYNTGGTGVLVRSPNACDASIANKPDGAKGTVTSSLQYCNSFDRVKVRFEDGVEGWVALTYLQELAMPFSFKFNINDRVQVSSGPLNVRSSPFSSPVLSFLGSQSTGTIGTVSSASFYGVPQSSSGFHYFWYVNFDSGTDGWAAENYLQKYQQCVPGSGSCCDSSGNFKPSSVACLYITTEYGCPWGSSCGANVGFRNQHRYCSGSSASCDGAYLWDPWLVADYCASNEICSVGNPSCVFQQSCVPQQCAPGSGPCCDGSGNFRPLSYLCGDNVAVDYSCSSSSCGGDVLRSYGDQYCSGSSSACNGATQWETPSLYSDCPTTQLCQDGNPGNCANDASCNPVNKFVIGDKVVVTDNGVNVRSSASLSGAVIGSVNTDDLGTVLSGPTNADGYTWWQVSYCGEVSGWTAENYLEKGNSVQITSKIDQQLLNLIDQYATSYNDSSWNLNLDQYKAWIVTIAWSEGGKGGYGAHSQGALGSDVFNHNAVGSSFKFSTGIGPFQLDRGGYDNWDNWSTIKKLNPEEAVKTALNQHDKQFGSSSNLNDFSQTSKWCGVNPNSPCLGNPYAHWKATTGTCFDDHKNGNVALNWNSIKAQLAQNAINDPLDMSYENNVQFLGKKRWKIKSSENITIDGVPVIFNGFYDTWLIKSRNAGGTELFKYYYTNSSEFEVWTWDNSNDEINKFKYIFVRDLKNCGNYITCAKPENIVGNSAGHSLSSPALDLLAPLIACGDVINEDIILTYDLIDCSGDGLIIGTAAKNTNGNIVLDCNDHTIGGTRNSNGISIEGNSELIVKNCNIREFENGINVDLGSNISLTGNYISENSNSGVKLINTINSLIEDNRIERNSEGVHINNSNSNNIKDNDLVRNSIYGINVFDSSLNTIWNNDLIENNISNAVDNINTKNAASANLWYYTGKGNLWDDFQSNPGYPNNYIVPGTAESSDNFPREPQCGDINNDGIYDIFDVVGLINYVFRGGEEPIPFWVGDLNDDGVGNIFDVTLLVEHVFRGGSKPSCFP